MRRFVLSRVIQSVVVLVLVMLIVFVVFTVLGNPVVRILPVNATDAQRIAYSQANGFSDPVIVQFARFVRQVVTLDFGSSYYFKRPSLPMVLAALPRTVLLASAAFLLAAFGGLLLGSLAAVFRGTWIDTLVSAASATLSSLAEFWIGLVLVLAVALRMSGIPTSGYGFGPALILPAATLAIPVIGRLALVVRTSILDVITEPHVLVARANGLGRWTVLRRYVLRNASPPTIAIGGLELTRMLVGGAVVVETVFAWPGIGDLYVQGMSRYDLPLISATVVVASVIVLVLNSLLDIAYATFDKRVTV
jgi:peptide/nickel transport system permease protein